MSIFQSNTGTIFKGVFIKIFKIFIVFYSMAMTFIVLDGMIASDAGDNKISKYAIVYGNDLNNGNVSPGLKASLDTAYNLFKNKQVEKIIVSGGLDELGFDEAKVMKKYLLEKGMKFPWIIANNNGYTTMETSKNAFTINGERGNFPNVGVIGVSQFFHISRVKLSLKKAGFAYVGSASPDYFELRDFYSLIKEVPAYIKYFFMGVGEDINIDKKDLRTIGNNVVDRLTDKETYRLNNSN